MAQKNYYYIGVMSEEGMKFVTSIDKQGKMAIWGKKEKPLAMTQQTAKDYAEALAANLVPATVVRTFWELDNQPCWAMTEEEKNIDKLSSLIADRASRGKVADKEETRAETLAELRENSDYDDELVLTQQADEQAQTEKKNWTDLLDSDVRERLATCSSTRDDILPLTQAFWNGSLKNSGKDYTAEDALVSVLRLVDENGRYFNLTSDDRDEILYEVGGIQKWTDNRLAADVNECEERLNDEDEDLDLTEQDEYRGR